MPASTLALPSPLASRQPEPVAEPRLEDLVYRTRLAEGPSALGRGPRGLALGLSLGIYALLGGAAVWVGLQVQQRVAPPVKVVTLSLVETEPALAAPPPPAAGPAASATAPASEPVASPEPSPLTAPVVPSAVAAPGGLAGGVPGGVVGGTPGGSPGGAAGGAPQGVEGGTVPPRFDAAYLNNPAPDYPSLSRRLREQGRVVLRVLVREDGAPDQVELRDSSGHPRLDRAALDAVRRWRFTPARKGAERLAAWVLVPLTFSLDA